MSFGAKSVCTTTMAQEYWFAEQHEHLFYQSDSDGDASAQDVG